MTVTFSILLLVVGGLALWLLTESKVRWILKIVCITLFCLMSVVHWSTLSSFLGWPANDGHIPEIVTVHHIIIKEPNKLTEYKGAIYITLEYSKAVKQSGILKFFGYKKSVREPRLFGLSYSRDLHEQLQGTMAQLKKGPVTGKFAKTGRAGRKGGKAKRSHGGESQETEWEFHELLPSELQPKPNQ